jgi:hypothetical protein
MKYKFSFHKSLISFIIEKEMFNTWSIGICFPFVAIGESINYDFSPSHYGLDLNTRIMYRKEMGYRGFIVQILGFGITIDRQWSY